MTFAMPLRQEELTPEERRLIDDARAKAHVLYEGKDTPHRSCGVCLAETFGLPWRPYQALRRGGITGEGACGAIRAGEMILGDLLGPQGPADPVSDRLKDAIRFYQAKWKERQTAAGWRDTICNTLVSPFPNFQSSERAGFCTSMAADAAELVAETLVRSGYPFQIEPISSFPAPQ
jgi:hypothetical protein